MGSSENWVYRANCPTEIWRESVSNRITAKKNPLLRIEVLGAQNQQKNLNSYFLQVAGGWMLTSMRVRNIMFRGEEQQFSKFYFQDIH